VPADQVLRKQVTLPLAARDNLRQVLGFNDHQVAEIHDSGALDPPRKQAAE
jgi:hypothetical protein